ncbi:MAG: GNAT family N-acetyltransferase [Gemmatimonadales bacterium]
MTVRIALVGDYDAGAVAHRAIPVALDRAAASVGTRVVHEWVGTETVDPVSPRLAGFDGVWCVPVSPYRSAEGALAAIRFARERRVPFLGSCAGFQHAVLESAEALWGVARPSHAELEPSADDPIVAPLVCALVEKGGRVRFAEGSRLASAYGRATADEEYHCSYGLAARCRPHLEAGPLRATAWDDDGDVRAVELDGHPFFVATLFQSERRALRDEVPPIVLAFVRAAAERARTQPGAPRGAPVVRRLDAVDGAMLAQLTDLLIDCVEGGASVSFMAPLTRERATAFWQRVGDGVAAGQRALLVAEDELGVCGSVQLVLDLPENQPHRADLAKLLVHRRARRRGLGSALTRAAEETARALGRTLLVLDAVTDGDAARLYARLGWRRVGDVPDFALFPEGGFCSTTFFYRDLRG